MQIMGWRRGDGCDGWDGKIFFYWVGDWPAVGSAAVAGIGERHAVTQCTNIQKPLVKFGLVPNCGSSKLMQFHSI